MSPVSQIVTVVFHNFYTFQNVSPDQIKFLVTYLHVVDIGSRSQSACEPLECGGNLFQLGLILTRDGWIFIYVKVNGACTYKRVDGYLMRKIFWQYERNNFQGGIDTRIFTARHDRKLRCVVSGPTVGQNAPDDEWHLSLSHPNREPTPGEIDSAIATHVPAQVPMTYLENVVLRTIDNGKPALHFHEATNDSSSSAPYVRGASQD